MTGMKVFTETQQNSSAADLRSVNDLLRLISKWFFKVVSTKSIKIWAEQLEEFKNVSTTRKWRLHLTWEEKGDRAAVGSLQQVISHFDQQCGSTMVWSHLGWMLYYWNHILQTDAHVSVFPFVLPPSFSPSVLSLLPLSKVRHQRMASYPSPSASHKKPAVVERSLYWALSSFNCCVIIAFTNIIRNPLLAIMDLYSIAASHLSHQVTSPSPLDILDNRISPAHAFVLFLQHTQRMISKHTIYRQDAGGAGVQ